MPQDAQGPHRRGRGERRRPVRHDQRPRSDPRQAPVPARPRGGHALQADRHVTAAARRLPEGRDAGRARRAQRDDRRAAPAPRPRLRRGAAPRDLVPLPRGLRGHGDAARGQRAPRASARPSGGGRAGRPAPVGHAAAVRRAARELGELGAWDRTALHAAARAPAVVGDGGHGRERGVRTAGARRSRRRAPPSGSTPAHAVAACHLPTLAPAPGRPAAQRRFDSRARRHARDRRLAARTRPSAAESTTHRD